MKKPIFSLVVLLLTVFFVSCGMNPIPEQGDTSRGGDDGGSRLEFPRTVTLRLADDGEYENDTIGVSMGNTVSSPRRQSRALSYEDARSSHDFFEAVFYYPGNNTIARAVWEIGEIPQISGVYKGNGVNYGNISRSPPGGQGSAVLFAGTMDDKTLLAIGQLVNTTEVDAAGTEVPTNGTTINAATRSVTFEVAALKAGTDFNAADSSFKTNFRQSPNGDVNAGNTVIYNDIFIHYNGKKPFPFFMLNRLTGPGDGHGDPGPGNPIPAGNTLTKGEYTFKIIDDSGTTFTDYAAGIILAGGYNFEVRNPRYIIASGLYQYSSIFVQDLRNGLIDMTNNKVAVSAAPNPSDPVSSYSPFLNPVTFEFTTTNSPNGSIFALVFEIFVNNLTPRFTTAASPTDDNYKPVRWRISPGVGTKWLDLDDGSGKDSEGGAILLGSGDVRAWLAPYLPLP